MTSFNYFTVDVEEWWSVHSFRHYVTDEMTDRFDDRIETGLEKLFDLLDKYNYTGTFFILGRIADKYPDIIAEIVKRGHDIGTHGYSHKLIYEQTHEEFEKDLIKSLEILEKISGSKIIKYRAPSYSIRKDTLWALEILERNGIKYDSSIVPSKNQRFGIKKAPAYTYKIILDNNRYIIEIPPNIVSFGFITLPITSGFFLRFFPKFIINKNIKYYLKNNWPVLFIVHNWEFDSNQPLIPAGFKAKIIHYTGLRKTSDKLEYFLRKYSFTSIQQAYSNIPELELKELA